MIVDRIFWGFLMLIGQYKTFVDATMGSEVDFNVGVHIEVMVVFPLKVEYQALKYISPSINIVNIIIIIFCRDHFFHL